MTGNNEKKIIITENDLMVVSDKSGYHLYQAHGFEPKALIDFAASLPETNQFSKDEFILEYFRISRARWNRLLDVNINENPIRRNIIVYFRRHPEKYLELTQRSYLVPLYEQIKKLLPSLISAEKMNLSLAGKKLTFITELAKIVDPKHSDSLSELWRLWNFWLLTKFYAGSDKEILELWMKRFKSDKIEYLFVRVELWLFDIEKEEAVLRLIKKFPY